MNPFATLLLFPFTPRRVDRAHEHTPIWRVYLIHWLGLIVLGIVAFAVHQLWRIAYGDFATPLSWFFYDPNAGAIGALVVVAGEVVFLAVASIMTCWAGRDEPPADSWRFSVRVSWLYAAHLSWVTGGIGVVVCIPDWSQPTLGPMLAIASIATVIVWSIVSYVRALTARAPIATSDTREPLCEWCGYNLFRIDEQGRCPECGRPVRESTNPDLRLPLTRRRDRLSWLAAWFRPEALFRSVCVHELSHRAVAYLLIALTTTVLTTTISLVGTIAAFDADTPTGDIIAIATVVGLTAGMVTAWTFLMLSSLTATVAGLLASRAAGRNRFTAALQVVMLAAGVFPPWTAFAVVSMVCIGFILPDRNMFPLVWVASLAANTLGAVFFAGAIIRRMKYVQYANR